MTANNSATLFVCSRPRKLKEQFLSSLKLKNTPQPGLLHPASWLQTHAPSVQAATRSWFWVSLSNLTSDKTLSGKMLQLIDCAHALGPMSAQATDSGSSRKIPHLEVHGGHVKRSRLLGACFSRRSVSHCGHSREYALHLQIPHHKTDTGDSALWQSNCLFCVQSQPQRSWRRSFRCSGGILVLFIALVVAGLSIPAVDSMPLMSLRLFPAFFHSASLSPCLISWSHQLFGSVQQSQVETALPREERRGLPVPTHPLQYAVYCSRWPITTTIRITTPNTFQLR